MLDVDTIVPFLIERELIDRDWIIDSELLIRGLPRRNRNWKIEGPARTGYLVKQPDDPSEQGTATLRCEAAFHGFCAEESAVAPMAGILPRLIHSHPLQTILVFELISDAVTLWVELEHLVKAGLAAEVARRLGQALGTVHRVFRRTDPGREPRLSWLPRDRPAVLSMHQPGPELRAVVNPAACEILRILQNDGGFRAALDGLMRRWLPETLIHGDVRLDNVLIRPSPAGEEPERAGLWIVDWEMVGIGDPAWDLAGALQDLLVAWVSTMPLAEELTAEQRIAQARLPLDAVRGATRALWSGYRAGADQGPVESRALLQRAVGFSGARLIQSAFEFAEGADRLPGPSVILLQLSANLLADPERGQLQLLGIPPRSSES